MDLITTPDQAVEHLVEHWREIEPGTAYPGLEDYQDDGFAALGFGARDVVLIKVRCRVDGHKYGAAAALDEDAPMNAHQVAEEVRRRVPVPEGVTVEWSTTVKTPGKWVPLPDLSSRLDRPLPGPVTAPTSATSYFTVTTVGQ